MSASEFAIPAALELMRRSAAQAPADASAGGVRRCGCGVVLSAYNKGSICFQCARRAAIEQQAAQLPAVRVVLPEVGPLLKAWREEHRATQGDLAQLLGLDKSYISLIECGKRAIRDIEQLARIAVRLGFPPELLGLHPGILAPAENVPTGQNPAVRGHLRAVA
jgi:DNA-binding XRE family transcriptional regulator